MAESLLAILLKIDFMKKVALLFGTGNIVSMHASARVRVTH